MVGLVGLGSVKSLPSGLIRPRSSSTAVRVGAPGSRILESRHCLYGLLGQHVVPRRPGRLERSHGWAPGLQCLQRGPGFVEPFFGGLGGSRPGVTRPARSWHVSVLRAAAAGNRAWKRGGQSLCAPAHRESRSLCLPGSLLFLRYFFFTYAECHLAQWKHMTCAGARSARSTKACLQSRQANSRAHELDGRANEIEAIPRCQHERPCGIPTTPTRYLLYGNQ